jgi:chitinase
MLHKWWSMLRRVLMLATVVSLGLSAIPDGIQVAQGQGTEGYYRIVGYYPSYAVYENYFVTDIAADELTHLNYGWGSISVTGQCESSDLWTDTQYSYPDDAATLQLRGNIRQLQLLREQHPELKILFTVGGWEHSERFSQVALTPESRERFAASCVAFLRQYLFDGLDIDWRYPVAGGQTVGRHEDRENFTLLMAELRRQLDAASVRDGKQYLLTMLAPATATLYDTIEIDQIHIYVDWINLMTFGYQGEWSEVASHHAPLFSNTRDPRGATVQQEYNVAGTVTHFLDAGVPANKLVVGIPFYAQTWRNVTAGDYLGLYQTTDGVPGGTRPGGTLYYRDMKPLLESENFIEFFDDEVGVPWLYNPQERIAVSYENSLSIRNKVDFVKLNELGGVMLWQVSFDDLGNTMTHMVYSAFTAR